MNITPRIKQSLENIINELSQQELTDTHKEEILKKLDLLINEYKLPHYHLATLISNLSNDDLKVDLIERYKFSKYNLFRILNSCSNQYKTEILLSKKIFYKNDILKLLQTLDFQTLIAFLSEHKDFCRTNAISPYEITYKLDSDQQKNVILNLENINLTLNEKREILVTLHKDVKQDINTTDYPEEYKSAIDINTQNGLILFDFEKDFENNLEDFKGLDALIRIAPIEFTEAQRKRVMKLCDICPNLKVLNTLGNTDLTTYLSNGSDYKQAEEWINSIISTLSPKHSKAQQLAIVDNAIGKQISYSPDFDTEIFEPNHYRALWKIINSGYGICDGIANVEKYILDRIGIASDIVYSNNHAFLIIKDIGLPLANGKTVKGNTILDPTWNLLFHRFGGKPNNFCISYEQARKNDVDTNGTDHNCHKNDAQLENVTLHLDDESLKKLFSSVNLADKNGIFPIINLLENSKQIDKIYANDLEQNINKQFSLLSKVCPEFATCQNSSIFILSKILLNNKNLVFNKCVIHRVYEKTDSNKRPILFVYIDSNELGPKFYYANKKLGQFIELQQEDFTKQFEYYEKDLEAYNFIRPWESHLSENSDKLKSKKGDIR